MKQPRGSRPSWRTSEVRFARPGSWLIAAVVVGMLLVEVWAGSRVAQLSLTLGQDRTALEKAQARLAFVRADLERRTTRAEAGPLASQLGLMPAEARQVVALPNAYLASATTPRRDRNAVPVLAWAEKASRAIVPEAMARVRAEN